MPRCKALLLLAFTSLLLACAWGASDAGIINPADVASSTAGAEDSGPRESCQVPADPILHCLVCSFHGLTDPKGLPQQSSNLIYLRHIIHLQQTTKLWSRRA